MHFHWKHTDRFSGRFRGRPPPPARYGPKFSQFHAVFRKIWQNHMLVPQPWGIGAPSYGESWIRPWDLYRILQFELKWVELSKPWPWGEAILKFYTNSIKFNSVQATADVIYSIYSSNDLDFDPMTLVIKPEHYVYDAKHEVQNSSILL